MRPTVTAILILIGAVVATVAGLFLTAAIVADKPSEFFNAFLVAFVVTTGCVGGLFVGAAAIAAWSVVSARPRPVRAIGTAVGTVLATGAVAVVVGMPTGTVAETLPLFAPAGVLAAISTATVAALARRRVP